MSDDTCVRCGRPAEGFTVYRGWRLCHNGTPASCYDIASGILQGLETANLNVNMDDLQRRLEECWALLQVHSPDYLLTGTDPAFLGMENP